MEDNNRQDNTYPAESEALNSSEGYEPPQNNEREERKYSGNIREGRVMRPRYQRGERAYTSSYGEDRRVPRPYRPTYNANPRPYHNNYQPRQNYGGNDGKYNRDNYYYRNDGYAPHSGNYHQGGYRQNAFRRDGGYNREGGYARREGNYRQEGYRQNGYNRYGGYSNKYNGGKMQRHTPDYNPDARYSLKKQIEYKEANFDPDAPIRLNKFLANAVICSRREADDFIAAGVVSVNGEIVKELGTKVKRSDKVMLHDQTVSIERKVYVLLNKPKNCITTAEDPQGRKTVMDLVKGACRERIYPVGRLDRNTTGVLLLTNDGELAAKLTHPKCLKRKIYQVTTDKNVTAADMQQILDGVELSDGKAQADAVEYIDPEQKNQIGIEIHSGKNRIVRRIFETLGYKVVKLDRVLFAGLTKKHLRRGDWRFLTQQEVNLLRMGAFE